MKGLICRTLLLAALLLSCMPCAADAREDYMYGTTGGYRTTFAIAGGSYEMYIDARNPAGITQVRGTCAFGGTFQRIDGPGQAVSFGNGVRVGPLHYQLDRKYTLPAGYYALDVVPSSDCLWKFILESTPGNPAALAPLQMFSVTPNGNVPTTTTAMGQKVEFHAQYRTNNDAAAPVSGTGQLLHNGAVVESFPLQVTTDPDTKAPMVGVGYTFDGDSAKYIGKDTARFIVTIGGKRFTTSTDFTVTR